MELFEAIQIVVEAAVEVARRARPSPDETVANYGIGAYQLGDFARNISQQSAARGYSVEVGVSEDQTFLTVAQTVATMAVPLSPPQTCAFGHTVGAGKNTCAFGHPAKP